MRSIARLTWVGGALRSTHEFTHRSESVSKLTHTHTHTHTHRHTLSPALHRIKLQRAPTTVCGNMSCSSFFMLHGPFFSPSSLRHPSSDSVVVPQLLVFVSTWYVLPHYPVYHQYHSEYILPPPPRHCFFFFSYSLFFTLFFSFSVPF